MPCFVPRCDSGYNSKRRQNLEKEEKNPPLFGVPADELKRWDSVIPRQDRKLTLKDKVCALHFQDDDIIKYFETKLPNGEIHRIPRERWMLRPGALPRIFPNCLEHLQKLVKRRQPKQREVVSNGQKPCPEPVVQQVNNISLQSDPPGDVDLRSSARAECPTSLDGFTFQKLVEEFSNIMLPSAQWGKSIHPTGAAFQEWTPDMKNNKKIIIHNNLKVEVLLKETAVTVQGHETVHSTTHISKLLEIVDGMVLCSNELQSRINVKCQGFLHRREALCGLCTKQRNKRSKDQKVGVRRSHDNKNRKLKRLNAKITSLSALMNQLQRECSAKSRRDIHVQIRDLPENEKEAVNACLQTLTRKPRGMRYSRNWIFQCILLRIKSSSAYNYLRRHKILSLPSSSTLHRYMRKLRPSYGFQPSVFSVMKNKSGSMENWEKRGVLLIDEMKLSTKLAFSKEDLKVTGFVDIGKNTPQHQKDEIGDHALVIIFQPFMGRWFQAVGAFLTKACANSRILHQLILEAVAHIENSGFFVDGIVSDGAQWNRGVWRMFAIKECNICCTHILDENRKLFFFSDFPHLIKCFQNWLVKQSEFKTPYGTVDFRLWKEVLKRELSKGPHGLRMCPKLSEGHLNPRYFEKMNVAKAYQLFGFDIATAMNEYGFENSEATVNFIVQMNNLIKAMTSRKPTDALRKHCREREVIQDFLTFLKQWKTSNVDSEGFISKSTYVGLVVTCQGVLQLTEYLIKNHGYKYVMVSRISQDNLERFFGMVRNNCGSNDHPDHKMFIYIYRLMCVYSLIKPPKGSNVNSGEIISSLLNEHDVGPYAELGESSNRNSWNVIKDVMKRNFLQRDSDAGQQGPQELAHKTENTDEALLYLAGFLSKKLLSRSACAECRSCLTTDLVPSTLILARDKFEALHYPNQSLVKLLSFVEAVIQKEVSENKIRPDFFLSVAEHLHEESEKECLETVGCPAHAEDLTTFTLEYYMTMRMNFILSAENLIVSNPKTKEKRKASKMT